MRAISHLALGILVSVAVLVRLQCGAVGGFGLVGTRSVISGITQHGFMCLNVAGRSRESFRSGSRSPFCVFKRRRAQQLRP